MTPATPAKSSLRFTHILCPVDFSESSQRALRYGVALARRSRARMTVLFVNDPLLGAAATAAEYDVSVIEKRTVAELRRFVARAVGANAPATTLATVAGHAAPEIIRAAENIGADLVVMGSRGLAGPGKWLFGSTTEKVLRKAVVPVLVIPNPAQRSHTARAGTLQTWPGARVLVPVDLSDYHAADVEAAIRIARSFDATPVLMYAMPAVNFPSWLRVEGRTYDRDRVAAARVELEKLAAASGGAECQVAVGEPAHAIVASAKSLRTGLIVMTIKRSAAPFGPRQGTIAYRVLSSDVVPVLAIPGKAKSSD